MDELTKERLAGVEAAVLTVPGVRAVTARLINESLRGHAVGVRYVADQPWNEQQHYQVRLAIGRVVSGTGLTASPFDTERVTPVPTLINCPACMTPHIDRDERATGGLDWTTRPHVSHSCAACKNVWKPYQYPTIGASAESLFRLDAARCARCTARATHRADNPGSKGEPVCCRCYNDHEPEVHEIPSGRISMNPPPAPVRVATPRFDALLNALLSEALPRSVQPWTQVLLVGSAPLAARGLRDVGDLDIIVGGALLAKLNETPGWLGEGECLVYQTPHGRIEAASALIHHAAKANITNEELWRDAEVMRGRSPELPRIMGRPHFVEVKCVVDREKDQDDVRLMNEHFLNGAPW